MGSRLYSGWEVGRLLDEAGLSLVEDDHDFVLPYGFYRQIPNRTASTFRKIDTTIGSLPGGDRLSSVSYWHCEI
jgi:hypothetical protein